DGMVEKTLLNPIHLDKTSHPGLSEHLELYSKALLEGFEVILVSHSLGNFYANAALRLLPDYTPKALLPSLAERTQDNPFYPHARDLVANVQIATPVAQAVNDSPWVNFKD